MDNIQREVDQMNWFHAIDFGTFKSPGRGGQPWNWSLFGSLRFVEGIDLLGMKCIDIGAMDGLMAFTLADRGAGEVFATDLYERDQFRLARRLLQLEKRVEYLPYTHLSQLEEKFGLHSFDLVVFAGVLYHTDSPLLSLLQCRNLCKMGGLMIVESACAAGDEPHLVLNPEMEPPLFDEYTTLFVPTRRAVEGMLKFAGFDVLGRVDIPGRNRTTLLAKATKPSLITQRTDLLRRIHQRLSQFEDDLLVGELNFRELEAEPGPASSIVYSGDRGVIELDPHSFRPASRFQPD